MLTFVQVEVVGQKGRGLFQYIAVPCLSAIWVSEPKVVERVAKPKLFCAHASSKLFVYLIFCCVIVNYKLYFKKIWFCENVFILSVDVQHHSPMIGINFERWHKIQKIPKRKNGVLGTLARRFILSVIVFAFEHLGQCHKIISWDGP